MGLGLLSPEISLPNFYPPLVGVGPACSVSAPPPTSLDGRGFFNSVVVRLPFNLILWLSDLHSAQFLMFLVVLSDGCSTF